MDAAKKVHIGLLTSRSGDRPHFGDFRGLVPAEVGVTIESVGVGPERLLMPEAKRSCAASQK